jgi:hypothetical protein
LTRHDRGSIGGRARRRVGGASAVVLAVAACAAAAPAPAIPGAAPPTFDSGGNPGPGGTPTPKAPDRDAAPRPVTPRPAAGAPGQPTDALAVRSLRVPAQVALATARSAGIAVSFRPPPGTLGADVRLERRDGAAPRRLVGHVLVAARAGRRATVRLRAARLRLGGYEVAVRVGAGQATLGPRVVARIRVA